VLERRSQGLSDERGSGPLPERPLLAPWLRHSRRDDVLLLEYADEIVALEGGAIDRVVPLLDGTRAVDGLEPGERDAVARLTAAGVVVPGPAVDSEAGLLEAALGRIAPGEAAARLDAATVAVAGAGAVAEAAASLLPGVVTRVGWEETPAGTDLAVVAPAPAELPELTGWNERCLASGTCWLLVLPFNGRFASVGPLFLPGETCCYGCFVRRRAAALPDPLDFLELEAAPASYPVGPGLAAILAGAAAVVAARWLARRDGALAGAFVAIELADGLRATKHRVLRVPRCDACSPAAGSPSLLPWASGLTR
jgi:bacteriocin biosynthesis cyclodehydratase domain-containing protein